MNSQILTKTNSFIKNRLIEILGFILIFCSFFLLAALISYSPGDPNFIYTTENGEINFVGGLIDEVDRPLEPRAVARGTVEAPRAVHADLWIGDKSKVERHELS